MRDKHYAEVSRSQDFLKGALARGAIFIRSETLTGGDEWPEGFQPRFPCKGMFWVPDIGEQLEVEIDDPEHPDPRVTGFVYSSDDDIDPLFKENYPFRRGWVSLSGHHLVFDDKPGFEKVLFYHNGGTGFEWATNGDEMRTVVGDLIEELQGAVERTVSGKLKELIMDNAERAYEGKLDVIVKGDKTLDVRGTLKMLVRGDVTQDFKGALEWNVKAGKFAINGQGGAKFSIDAGKIYLGGTLGDLFTRLSADADALIQNAPTLVSTSVGPGVLNPAVVTVLTQSKAIWDALKP